MRRSAFVLQLVTAMACGTPPCDPAVDLGCGAFTKGEAAFAANPAALDGLYVPALAGCVVTETPGLTPGGIRPPVRVSTYDSKGRQTRLEMRHGDEVPDVTVTTWEGPCRVAVHRTFAGSNDYQTVSNSRCDDAGWPIERTDTLIYGDSEDVFEGPVFDRTYDKRGRLVETLTWSGPDAIELSSRATVRWRKGRPELEQIYSAEGELELRTLWSWREPGLLMQIRRDEFGTGPEPHFFQDFGYKDDRLSSLEFNGELVYTWARKPDAQWPHRGGLPGAMNDVYDFDCPSAD